MLRELAQVKVALAMKHALAMRHIATGGLIPEEFRLHSSGI
jgi:hypothetical protein